MHFPLSAYLGRAVIALVVSAVLQACSQQGSDGAGTDIKSETSTSVTETADAKDAVSDSIAREGVVVIHVEDGRSGGARFVMAIPVHAVAEGRG